MTIEYEKDYLKELYESGKCKNKKYRFDAAVAATRIEDLFVLNSLNIEALQGLKDHFSIRIDYHYRLEFKIRTDAAEVILTVCIVTDITNHYQ